MISILMVSFLVCGIQIDESNFASSSICVSSNHEVQNFSTLVDARPLWSTPCQKTNSSPVIAGDKVFLLERLNRQQERVRCFQLGNGQTLWEHRYDAHLPIFFDDEYGWGPHSTPTIHQNKVITVGVSGKVWAIDIETGKTLWGRDLWNEYQATRLERGVAATPVIESGQVILPLGGVGSGIISISVNTGKTLWISTD